MLRLPRAMDHPKPFPMQRWLRLALVPGGHHLSLAPPSCKYHTSFRLHDTQTPDQRKQKRRSKAKTRNRGTASTGEGESQAEARASRNFTQQLQKLAKAAGRLEETAVSAVLEEMERAAVRAKDKAYTDLLKRCREEQALLVCQRLHAHLLSLSPSRPKFSTKPALGSSAATLISTYGRCGRVDLDSAVFDEMPKQAVEKQEVGVWNALIQTYTQRGHGSKALALFHQMQQASVAPDAFTFSSVLKACATEKDLEVGKQVHAQLLRQRFLPNVVLSNALISMYGKCGQVEDARAVFQEMKERDFTTWNSIITAETNFGEGKKALALFHQMQQAGVAPNTITFSVVLKACATEKDLETGKQVHAQLLRQRFLPNVVLSNALISMYGKCGQVEDARAVFQEMKERNVETWNSMITAETNFGEGKKALALFHQMQQASVAPDAFTFSSVLKACATEKDLEVGKQVHAQLLRQRFLPDVVLSNALISMYGKCGQVEDARAVFQQIKERNIVTWNSMITAETNFGEGKKALTLFHQMQQAGEAPDAVTFSVVLKACATEKDLEVGKQVHAQLLRQRFLPDVVLSNALISMYGKCGQVEDARAVFQEMKERNVETWTSMITAETNFGEGKKALALFHQMQQAGVAPDAFTSSVVLKACATEKDLETGKQVHAQLLRQRFLPDVVLSSALISMYGKCGKLEDARAVFQEMKERNIVTWNSMIAAYGGNGQERKALATFDDMLQQGMQPDVITFKLLNAYNQARLVEEGASCLAAMREKHAVQPAAEHYNRMVDLLDRTGRGKEAETLLNSMDVAMRPLLANDGNDTERAGRAAQEVEIQNTKKVSQIFDELFVTTNKK